MSEQYVCPYIEIDEGHISCKRISDLEAKLEKAVEALRAVENYSDGCGCCSSQIVSMNEKVEAFFKEIKGA